MDSTPKPDEHYIDGKDKWTVHYISSDDTRVNPGDYKETVQYIKNGDIVGQTVWRKDKTGVDKIKPYEDGVQSVPSTAKKVEQKVKR
jgi:hypothetical protein